MVDESYLTPEEEYIKNSVKSLNPPIINWYGERIGDIFISPTGSAPLVHRLLALAKELNIFAIFYVRLASKTFEIWPARPRTEPGSSVFIPKSIERQRKKGTKKPKKFQEILNEAAKQFIEEFGEKITKALAGTKFNPEKFPFSVQDPPGFWLFLQMIDALMRMPTKDKKRIKIAVIFDDFHYLLQSSTTPAMMGYIRDLFKLWQFDNMAYRGNLIVLVTSKLEDLDADIRRYTLPVKIPYPSQIERVYTIERVMKKIQEQNIIKNTATFLPETIAQWSAGMSTISDLVDGVWLSATKYQHDWTPGELHHDLILKKREKLASKFGELLQYHDPRELLSWDQVIIDDIIRSEIQALAAGDKNMLLAGPPGTGKTLSVQAIAHEQGIPLITLRGSLLNKFVGESEKNLMEVFEVAENLGRSIIFFDEIDTMFPRRGTPTGSDVTQRMQGLIFQKLDGIMKKEGASFACATNFPQALDLALLRRVIPIPILPPDTQGLIQIAMLHIKKYGYSVKQSQVKQLLKDTTNNYWTGAVIAGIIERAHLRVQYHQEDDFFARVQSMVHSYRFPKRKETDEIIYATLEMIDARDIVPARFRNFGQQPVEESDDVVTPTRF